jgi:hypothetical protein
LKIKKDIIVFGGSIIFNSTIVCLVFISIQLGVIIAIGMFVLPLIGGIVRGIFSESKYFIPATFI